jgi:hypothetical protein
VPARFFVPFHTSKSKLNLHAKTVGKTILGRRRLKDINSQNAMVWRAERNAVNALYKEVRLTLK